MCVMPLRVFFSLNINIFVNFHDYFYTHQQTDEGLKSSLAAAGLAAMLPFAGLAGDKVPEKQKPAITVPVLKPLSVQEALLPENIVAATLTGEARGEGEKGMQAVLNVLMNRLKYAKETDLNKLKDVSLARKQFSIWNDKKTDEQKAAFVNKMRKTPQWATAIKLIDNAKNGKLPDITGNATFYHTNKVDPDWSDTFVKTNIIGNHIFYNHGKEFVSPFIPKKVLKKKPLKEEIDTPNNGFLQRPVGGPNLVNFSPNFKDAPGGIYLGSDQIHTPTIQAARLRNLYKKKLRKKNKNR